MAAAAMKSVFSILLLVFAIVQGRNEEGQHRNYHGAYLPDLLS